MTITAILSLKTTDIWVSSLRKARAFYSLVFQQMPEMGNVDSGPIVYLLGTQRIVLWKADEPAELAPIDTQISLLVDDFQFEYQRILHIPNASISDVQEISEGGFLMFVRDPDGNQLKLRSFELNADCF